MCLWIQSCAFDNVYVGCVFMSNVFQDGVDVVYETVGGDMFDTCVKRYVTSDNNNNLAVTGSTRIICYLSEVFFLFFAVVIVHCAPHQHWQQLH